TPTTVGSTARKRATWLRPSSKAALPTPPADWAVPRHRPRYRAPAVPNPKYGNQVRRIKEQARNTRSMGLVDTPPGLGPELPPGPAAGLEFAGAIPLPPL